MTRRNIELILLLIASPLVILMFAMLAINEGQALDMQTLGVPIGIFGAFIVAHIATRILAPEADPAILPISFALSGIGIAFITRVAPFSDSPNMAINQVIWLFLGVVLMIAVMAFLRNPDRLANYKYTLAIVGVILLLSPMIPGIGQEIYGSRIWLHVGGFSFQPGEIAKIIIVLFLAGYLAQNREMLSVFTWHVGPFRLPDIRTLLPLLLMWGVAMLIVVFEKDLGSALVFAGTRKIRFAGSFDRYRNVIGLRESCSVKELAQRGSESVADVQRNVRKMLAKGMFRQATLDEASGLLLMTPEASESHERELAEARRAERQQALVQSASSKESASLTAEQQQLLDRGKAFIAVIREGNEAIPDEETSRTLDRIEHVVTAILDAAAENPELIDDLDRLLDYYLPTTVKLLETYRELDSQPIQSDNIVDSKREIEKALDSLSVAFEKLLDSLFRDVATDVSSDITVLRTVLAQEGLTESPFDKAR